MPLLISNMIFKSGTTFVMVCELTGIVVPFAPPIAGESWSKTYSEVVVTNVDKYWEFTKFYGNVFTPSELPPPRSFLDRQVSLFADRYNNDGGLYLGVRALHLADWLHKFVGIVAEKDRDNAILFKVKVVDDSKFTLFVLKYGNIFKNITPSKQHRRLWEIHAESPNS